MVAKCYWYIMLYKTIGNLNFSLSDLHITIINTHTHLLLKYRLNDKYQLCLAETSSLGSEKDPIFFRPLAFFWCKTEEICRETALSPICLQEITFRHAVHWQLKISFLTSLIWPPFCPRRLKLFFIIENVVITIAIVNVAKL